MFKVHIARNMEFYADDILVKSRVADHHLKDFKETLKH